MKPRRLRGLLAVLLLGLAALSVLEYRTLERRLTKLAETLSEDGVAERHPGVVSDLRRAPGKARSTLRAARVLLADELERGIRQDPETPRQPQASLARLRLARELAAEALREQPASWQAWMVLGGATYLELARTRDPRLMSARDEWLGPLEKARELAPGQPEPTRLLAAAYLSQWSALPPASRQQAESAVAASFEDPVSFRLLVGLWLRVAPSLERAFAAIPDSPEQWATVRDIYSDSADWERFCESRERWLTALETTAPERLAAPDSDSKTRLPGRTARRLLAQVAPMPPSDRFAPFVAQAFSRLPSDEPISPNPRAFQGWVRWAFDRCVYDRCPFTGGTLGRLGEAGGGLQPADRSILAWMSGDRATADDLLASATPEERTEYLVFKLRQAESPPDAGAVDQIRSALAASPAGRRWDEALRQTEGERSWGGESWRQRGNSWSLGPIVTPPAGDLRIRVRQAQSGTAPVLARWDGTEVGCFAAVTSGRIDLRLAATQGVHHLELIPATALRLSPGEVELIRAEFPAGRPSE